ncbi:MAG: phosphatidate cytidylyltransferase [Termitinemataceae bacterium]|nr:MAG: phosphatidate cytidylyltransferase [Termitinemataceae bacterium]
MNLQKDTNNSTIHKKSNIPFGAHYYAAADAVQTFDEASKELLRKAIHLSIAFTPTLAAYSKSGTVIFLTLGVLFYICLESLRLKGLKIPFFSSIARSAARPRDGNNFVMGPVTLGCGALIALILYPAIASTIAIYALAFGDGLASVVGRIFGRARPAFLCGKSMEGSAMCFTSVFAAALFASHNAYISLVTAIATTIVEALPLKDYDNIAIPITAGLAVELCQSLLNL